MVGRLYVRGWSWLGLAGSPVDELCDHAVDVCGERHEWSAIRFRTDPDDDVGGDARRQDARSGELPKPALDAISSHRGLPKPGNDQADTRSGPAWMHERGSGGPNLEERGSDTLPLCRDTL
jgi:hypothetical protein